MLNIKNVSLRGMCVALRFFRRYEGAAYEIKNLTEKQNKLIQFIAEEHDRRKNYA